MEPLLSVLLYSKYSSYSKQLMGFIQKSEVDLARAIGLQTLCVDNEKIRNRIMKNKDIDVISVPCLLIIYPDGGIEKYDGENVFDWIGNVISKIKPPPPIPPPTQPPPVKEETNDDNPKQRYRRKPVDDGEEIQEHKNKVTSISDLPVDEDDDISGDRYRAKKPRGRIRIDPGNYEDGDGLFKGEAVDMRKAKKSAIKNASKLMSGSTDIMSKAKELAKAREMDNSSTNRPPGSIELP